MKKKTIYLAGPIAGLKKAEAWEWRIKATEKLKRYYKVINPLDKEPVVKKYVAWPRTHKRIFTLDMARVRRSDIILANFDGWRTQSVGTLIEIGLALGLGKEIYIVIHPTARCYHPFVVHSGSVFHVLGDALEFLVHKAGRSSYEK